LWLLRVAAVGQLQQQLERLVLGSFSGWFTLERIFSYQLNSVLQIINLQFVSVALQTLLHGGILSKLRILAAIKSDPMLRSPVPPIIKTAHRQSCTL
jgi:hypothetical protein